MVSVDFVLLALAGVLSLIGSKTTYYIWKVLAGVAWVGLGVYWIAEPFTDAGSSAHTIALVVVFGTGIACFFWSFWTTKITNGQETGGRFRLPFMQSDEEEENEQQRRSLPTRQQRQDAYIARLNAAMRGEGRRMR